VPIEDRKSYFPLAFASSSGSGGVSAPFSILPEVLAERAELFNKTVLQMIAAPSVSPKEAAQTLTAGLEKVAKSIDAVCRETGSSAFSVQETLNEAMRTNIEQAFRYLDELVVAQSPADAMKLQMTYLSRQTALFAEQARGVQSALMRMLAWPAR
jgi:hypothetical protein